MCRGRHHHDVFPLTLPLFVRFAVPVPDNVAVLFLRYGTREGAGGPFDSGRVPASQYGGAGLSSDRPRRRDGSSFRLQVRVHTLTRAPFVAHGKEVFLRGCTRGEASEQEIVAIIFQNTQECVRI